MPAGSATLRLLALLVIIALPWAAEAQTPPKGMTYSIERFGTVVRLRASGQITLGETERLRAEVQRSGATELLLHSPGGLMQEGMRLGRAIRAMRLVTRIPPGAGCASACFSAFVGGVRRRVDPGGRLGVHRPTATNNPTALLDVQSTWAQHGAARAMERMETLIAISTTQNAIFLQEMGIGLQVLELGVRTPPEQVAWLDPNQLMVWRIVTLD